MGHPNVPNLIQIRRYIGTTVRYSSQYVLRTPARHPFAVVCALMVRLTVQYAPTSTNNIHYFPCVRARALQDKKPDKSTSHVPIDL